MSAVPQENRGRPACKDRRVNLDRRVFRAIRVVQVLRVNRGFPVRKDQSVPRVIQVCRVPKKSDSDLSADIHYHFANQYRC